MYTKNHNVLIPALMYNFISTGQDATCITFRCIYYIILYYNYESREHDNII